MAIENIKNQPKGFRVVDDHIWDIIVRGYGSSDQLSDVFTTLANYAGYEAFWENLYTDKTRKGLILSFVKIDNKWHIFDVYNKKCFMDSKNLALPTPCGLTYVEYLSKMDKTKFKSSIRRAGKQKTFSRFIYEIKKLLSGGKALNG